MEAATCHICTRSCTINGWCHGYSCGTGCYPHKKPETEEGVGVMDTKSVGEVPEGGKTSEGEEDTKEDRTGLNGALQT